MTEAKLEEDLGTITISEEVITNILQKLGQEFEPQKKGLRRLFGQNPHLDIEENVVKLSVATSIPHGKNIREECKEMQQRAKQEIEEVTGLEVSEINIKVEELIFPEEEEEE